MNPVSPISKSNTLLETSEPLTNAQKDMFAYFGENAKIIPPLRILNPHNIKIGDYTSIREGSHINSFVDLSFLMNYIEDKYRDDFDADDYKYDGKIEIERECQIGRFAFVSCNKSILIERNVVFSERVFVGDNNHGFSHPEVPIVQQPNRPGEPVRIGKGSWIGVGAAILAGAQLGRNTVVGANSVVKRGRYADHSVIAPPAAQVQFRSNSEHE